MGYDKLLSFLVKNLHNNVVEDLYGKPVVVTNHVFFDLNFIIYNSIMNIENDINNIYIIIFSIPYTDIVYINEKLITIFNSYHWKTLLDTNKINMFDILDGNNIDEILSRFKLFIDKYVDNLLYYNVILFIKRWWFC